MSDESKQSQRRGLVNHKQVKLHQFNCWPSQDGNSAFGSSWLFCVLFVVMSVVDTCILFSLVSTYTGNGCSPSCRL